MNPFDVLKKQPRFFDYIAISILVFGIFAFLNMRREARPNVNLREVYVSLFYPGASPSDVEQLVIDPIEEKIQEIDGVEEFQSTSSSSRGSIVIKIDNEFPEPQDVIEEIRREILQTKGLPDSLETPLIIELKTQNIPVLKLALYGDLSSFEMHKEVEKLKDFLRPLPGVQSVVEENSYDSNLQFKILAKPEKLDENDITLMEIITSLREWTKKRPGGLIESTKKAVNLEIGSDYNKPKEIQNLIIRSNDSNKQIQLSDLATFSFDKENIQQSQIFENKKAVLVIVIKKPSADIIQTVENLKKALKNYSPDPSLKYKIYFDESKGVKNRLQVVSINALFGLFLVLCILALFLDFRSAFVSALGIPIAMLGGTIILFYLGETISTMTILGLTIVLGMLVDDAIVVCENIYFHMEAGLTRWKAAIKGAQEMAIPVTATVLTTIFSFAPILFMKDVIGQFLRVIPITVISMLIVSLFEALFILPVHAQMIMKVKKQKAKRPFSFPLKKLEDLYEKYLKWSFKYPKWINLFLIVFLFVSAFQGLNLFRKFTLFPARGLKGVNIRMELSPNSPLEETEKYAKKLSGLLKKGHEDVFEGLYATIGQAKIGGSYFGSRKTVPNIAMIKILFTSDPSFIKKEKKVFVEIQRRVKKFSDKTGIFTSLNIFRPGPPVGKPIQLQVTSRSKKDRRESVELLKAELSKIKGVQSLETDENEEYKKHRIIIDHNLALSEGINPLHLSQSIFSASTGSVVNEALIENEKVELLVGLSKNENFNSKQILNLKLRNKRGQAMPIHSFTKIKEELSPASIQRWNRLNVTTLLGEVDEDVISGKEANEKIKPLIEKLTKEKSGLRIEAGGEEKESKKALQNLVPLYFLALLLIFFILSLSFDSLCLPLLILMTIPMGISGMIWALTFHGQVLSLMSLIGTVGLSGVVVNNSIILFKTFQENMKKERNIEKALILSSLRRLRPIILTSFTTLFGLFPSIYGLGLGIDSLIQPVTLVIGWGLFTSTLLILLSLPTLSLFVFSLKLTKKNLPSSNHQESKPPPLFFS